MGKLVAVYNALVFFGVWLLLLIAAGVFTLIRYILR